MAALYTSGRVNRWSESLCLFNIGHPAGVCRVMEADDPSDNAPG